MGKYPYEKVNSVVFQNNFAALMDPYDSIESYETFLQSPMVRDEKLHPGAPGGYSRTKYAVNSKLVRHVGIHHIGFSSSDKSHIEKPRKNKYKTVHTSTRFLHFSFGHGDRSLNKMAAVSNITTFANLRKIGES